VASAAPLRAGFAVRARRHAYNRVEPRAVYEQGARVPRNSVASALALAAHVGVASDPGSWSALLPVSDEDATRAHNRLVEAGVAAEALATGAVVGLNPGRTYPSKEWSRDRFVELARELAAAGRSVMVMWGPGEEATAGDIVARSGRGVVLAPPLTLAELPGALRALSLLVTIDSGLKHLAVATGTPTVSLFGSTDPREWHLGGERDRYLWRGFSCSPCRRTDCPFGAPCMRFETAEVMTAIRDLEAA
jgi:ADP-heptose:LPS heptosyltransferase